MAGSMQDNTQVTAMRLVHGFLTALFFPGHWRPVCGGEDVGHVMCVTWHPVDYIDDGS